MRAVQIPYVSVSLARLRRGVTLCCWIVGLAATLQTLVFCVAAFMDLRYQVLQDKTPVTLIVSPGEAGHTQANPPPRGAPEPEAKPVDPNRVRTKNDRVMEQTSTLAYGAGMIGIVLLLPMLIMGALLTAGSATPGVERTVSAFMWALVVAVMILPFGELLGLPWREGALVSYSVMTQEVDLVRGGDDHGWGTPLFYARFALLPLTCVVGMTLVGLGFSSGVSAGIMPKEDVRLDPTLEREAANITPGSHHGSRAAAAMRSSNVMPTPAPAAAPPPPPPPPKSAPPSITQLSPGEAPKRLI